jgi:hypothetical protein
MVNLRTGQVVIVFQAYAKMSPLKSCQVACREFGIELLDGPYRMDYMLRDATTGKIRWNRRYSFVLKTKCP